MKYTVKYLLLFLLPLCLLVGGCANPVAPEGGPKDTKPPVALNFSPPNFSTNFRENSIKIDFNKFLVLKNTSTEVTVSPPLKSIPELRLRGKSLIIKVDDTLVPGTTYSIDFGNCISDMTENNLLTGFSYVFSTGDHIDSLSLRGTVINAFDLAPQKDLFALLYIDCNDTLAFDSLPFKVKPYYVTKTNAKGEFLFHNLKSSPMKLTALADQNSNLIFDQANEKVAFIDSLVHPYYIPKPKIDSASLKADSLGKGRDSAVIKKAAPRQAAVKVKSAADSAKKDSAVKQPPIPNNLLRLFEDIDSIQRIQKALLIKKGLVLISFRFPTMKLDIRPLNLDTTKPWALMEYSTHKDSLYLWLLDHKTDSLFLRVSQDTVMTDTLKLELLTKDAKALNKKKEQKKVFLGVNYNTMGGTLNQFASNLLLTFSYPLSAIRTGSIRLIQDKDTLKPKIFFMDSIKRVLAIETKWKEDKSYSVFIPDSVFTGINGLSNDTLKYSFKTKQAREFGNLILELDIAERPGFYVIQLLNEKGAVLGERKINANGKIKFEYLIPGKFRVKAIYDRNHNGRWDTGNFRKKIQPEEVFFLNKTIEIRANWDVEEKWVPSASL